MLHEIFKGMDNAAQAIDENFKHGSVVEQGTDYVKYADGTQFVSFKKTFPSLAITDTAGSFFRSGQESILFTEPFLAGTTPSVVVNLSGATLLVEGSATSPPGHDGFSIYVMRPVSTTAAITIAGEAKGVWK